MPGGIRANLQRYVTDAELDRMRAQTGGAGPAWKTPEQGAATSLLVATSPLLEGVGGRYFEDRHQAGAEQPRDPRGGAAVAPRSHDAAPLLAGYRPHPGL